MMAKLIPDLILTTGPGTIVEPAYLNVLADPPASENELKVHQISPDHRVFMHGQFEGFHLYGIATHGRFEIAPGSVRRIDEQQFVAHLNFETARGKQTWTDVTFNSPLLPFESVTHCTYGSVPDSFEIALFNKPPQRFQCSLSFFRGYATDAPPPALELVYFGMAEKNGRQAYNRLGEGHEKLQQVLANQGMQGGKRATSIIMYRPSPLEPPRLSFPHVIESLEASLIQHFKTSPLNTEHLNFPKNRTQLTDKLRSIGVTEIGVEIEAPSGTMIYSDAMPEHLEVHRFLVEIP